MTTSPDREADANRLAGVALAAGDPTDWFGQLYAQVRSFMAPGGPLVVVASALAAGGSPEPGPPWPGRPELC